ncbi:hypothetical protein D3C78_1231290 [compost metagenome]
MSERQRFAGLDGEFPQRQFALFAQGDPQKISFTHRYATGREDQIDILQLTQSGTSGLQIVRKNARVDNLTAQTLQPAAQQHPVAVVDLSRTQRLARLNQFVAGRQHRHTYLANDLQLGVAQ